MAIQRSRLRGYKVFMFGCALLTLAAATPAFALGQFGADVTVRYSDLDLNTAEGAQKLLKRIEKAVESVCAPLYRGTTGSRIKRSDCQHQLTAETVAKMNFPQLAAAYESTLKKPKSRDTSPG